MLTQQLSLKPITLSYLRPHKQEIATLRQQSNPIKLTSQDNLLIENSYYRAKLPGTSEHVFAREAVKIRLLAIAKQLAPQAGLVIFDVFRTIVTQQALVDLFCDTVRNENPQFNEKQVYEFARQFVSDPTALKNPPHNTGGAVDLAIYDVATGKLWDFGGEFDELHDISYTCHFEKPFAEQHGFTAERWQTVCANRRILYHLMIEQGFTNFAHEWWHYDIGDHLWAEHCDTEMLFSSMETAVQAMLDAKLL